MRNDKKVVVKVYHHIWATGFGIEQSMVFFTKEFGWVEYFDKADSLHFETKKDLIANTYMNMSTFKKFGMLQYLGKL